MQVQQHREPSDFTPFREAPLLRLDGRLILLDFYFLCEKAESGPFWAARRQIPESESNVYFSFWGDLFESYIADVLKQGADPQFNTVLPYPRFPDGTQLTDCAIVCDRALLMIEAKMSTISARAKYGADLSYLERTLRRNFVENGNSPKAVRQLVNGIKNLFRDGRQVNGLNVSKIDTVFPIIVTRDEVGGTVGINPFLNETFQELLQAEGLKIRQSVTPLICLSAEDIERLAPRGKEVRFDKVFEAYFKGCKRDNAKLKPFMPTPNSVLRSLAKGDTPDVFKDIAREIGRLSEAHMRTAFNTA